MVHCGRMHVVNCTRKDLLRLSLDESKRLIADDNAHAVAVLQQAEMQRRQESEEDLRNQLPLSSAGPEVATRRAKSSRLDLRKKEDLKEFFTQAEGKCSWIPIEAPHKTPAKYMEFFLPESSEPKPPSVELGDPKRTRVRRLSVNAARRSRRGTAVTSPKDRIAMARKSIMGIAETLNDGDEFLARRREAAAEVGAADGGGGGSGDEAASVASTELVVAAAVATKPTQRHKKGLQKKVPCALCLMRFPVCSLSASVSRQAVYRQRQKWAAQYGSCGVEQPERKFLFRLYDELKVCLFCSQLFDFPEEVADLAEAPPLVHASEAGGEVAAPESASLAGVATNLALPGTPLPRTPKPRPADAASSRAKAAAKRIVPQIGGMNAPHMLGTVIITAVCRDRLEELHIAEMAQGHEDEEKAIEAVLQPETISSFRGPRKSTRASRAGVRGSAVVSASTHHEAGFSLGVGAPPQVPAAIRPSPRTNSIMAQSARSHVRAVSPTRSTPPTPLQSQQTQGCVLQATSSI